MDAVVGLPYTRYVGVPPEMLTPPTFTVMPNIVLFTAGTVENVNIGPPFDATGTIDADAVDDTLKSDAMPVEAPALVDTLMVQLIAPPTRCGDPATHTSDDAVVGMPYTTNVGAPDVIVTPDTPTDILKVFVMLAGVTEKVKEMPPFDVVGVMDAAEVDETAKSVGSPVVAPAEPDTVIVHLMSWPVR